MMGAPLEVRAMLETSAQIVDALRIRLGVQTDSAVAAALGVNNSAVGHWRACRSAMSPELAMKAAELLGVEAGPLVLACLAETERRPAIAALFRQLASKLAPARPGRRRKVAAALVAVSLGSGLIAAPEPSHAATGAQASGLTGIYIMRTRARVRRPRRRRRSGVIPLTA